MTSPCPYVPPLADMVAGVPMRTVQEAGAIAFGRRGTQYACELSCGHVALVTVKRGSMAPRHAPCPHCPAPVAARIEVKPEPADDGRVVQLELF